MQPDDEDVLFLQEEEGEQQPEEEEEEDLRCTVKQLSLLGEEDAVIYKLRRGQEQIKVRELRSKGLSFQIWPAAHALCSYLEDIFGETGMFKTHVSQMPTSGKQQNMRVLELGAGTGMVGILCAVLGGHCTITDLPHVTSNLEHNAGLNQEIIESSGLGGSVIVKMLRWGERPDMEAIGCSFDLVVASDVVYYDHLFEPLLCTLKWLLYSPSCHDTCKVASTEDNVAPSTTMITTTTTTNGSNATSEEATPSFVPTVETVVRTLTAIERMPSSIGRNAAILEEVLPATTDGTVSTVPTSGVNSTTISEMYSALETSANMPRTTRTTSRVPNTTAGIATCAISPTLEVRSPIVLLAHLRRWKKDSHFFKKASKLFHVTVVYKYSHEANSRTGVTVYAFSRKKN